MSIIEINDVSYSYRSKYQTVNALKKVNCKFESGIVYSLMGRSGSGKTTLLSLLAGLDVPESGQIIIEGTDTSKIDLERFRREKVAVIYQDFRLFPLLTVLENIMYPMELNHMKVREAKVKAEKLLERVGLSEEKGDRFPHMLSGGEQQRVAIARALGINTNIILADEPTGNLDEENSNMIFDILYSLAHDDGYSVIIVTHDENIGDRSDVKLKIHDGYLDMDDQ